MTYEEQLLKLTNEDFFQFFESLKAEPRWVTSAGHRSIQVLGLCHHGNSHSVLFDPSSLKVTCFSLCGGGFLFHNYVKKALELNTAQEAKNFIEQWIKDRNIDLASRISREVDKDSLNYKEEEFVIKDIPPIEGLTKEVKEELYKDFDTSVETLSRLVWHTKDGIDVEQLVKFEVAYYPKNKTIILPHHNINGEIVGLFERYFVPLRKDIKNIFQEDVDYHWLCQFPRAKYLPLLKEKKFLQEDNDKKSWSFPNSKNLYGLHLAKEAIQKTEKVIVFEGAKSVMLAHQYGYPYAVASHTFGISKNHINMLIKCGAKEIILAFDKQYETTNETDKQWRLYEKKTKDLAKTINKFVNVSRIIDFQKSPLLDYKDSPIDKGKENFEKLFFERELLAEDKEEDIETILLKLSRPKIKRIEPVLYTDIFGKELITEI